MGGSGRFHAVPPYMSRDPWHTENKLLRTTIAVRLRTDGRWGGRSRLFA